VRIRVTSKVIGKRQKTETVKLWANELPVSTLEDTRQTVTPTPTEASTSGLENDDTGVCNCGFSEPPETKLRKETRLLVEAWNGLQQQLDDVATSMFAPIVWKCSVM